LGSFEVRCLTMGTARLAESICIIAPKNPHSARQFTCIFAKLSAVFFKRVQIAKPALTL
jgi:hypothetical protein